MTEERYVASHRIDAPAGKVFALLADPTRHHETEPSDWVRNAIDTEPITAVGQVFGMNMYLDAIGGAYTMHNRVIALEPDRVIAWAPGQYTDDGRLEPGGWTWRYDLVPDGDGTDVTLTYDWSETPQSFRDSVSKMPPFTASFLDKSLASLAGAVNAS